MTKAEKKPARVVPSIRPKEQTGNYWNAQGQSWREAFIALPEGMVAQDLTDHPVDAWRLIQEAPNLALRRFDKVFAVSHDGRWAVEARVSFADPTKVVLAKPQIIQLVDPKDVGLYDEGTYRVVPDPQGYIVESTRSGARASNQVYANAAAAKAALLALYPARMAS